MRNASEAQSGIIMDLRAQLQRMQVLVRNDRQMTLSGELSRGARTQARCASAAILRVDRASIVLPEASAPTLGDDVVVVRNADLRNPGAVEARQARGELEPASRWTWRSSWIWAPIWRWKARASPPAWKAN